MVLSSYDLYKHVTFLDEKILKELLANLLKLIINPVIIDKEESEVLLRRGVLIVHHGARAVLHDLLGHHIDVLTLLLPSHGRESLRSLILIICVHITGLLLDCLLVTTVHRLKDS